ncbi:MAG: hypothetical protein ACYTHJ_19625 [Planctomycetota bacterium]|jgi:hypothetical protein
MKVIIRTGNIGNRVLRLFSSWLLVTAQLMLFSGGCDQTVDPGNDDRREGVNDIGTGGGDRDTADDATNGVDADNPNDNQNGGANALTKLQGDWAVERISPEGETIWGWATIEVLDASTASLTVTRQEGQVDVAAMNITRRADDSLEGFWTSNEVEASDEPNWSGELGLNENVVVGVLTDGSAEHEITFYRGIHANHETSGMWVRESDGADVVVAYDGGTILISALDEAGDWEPTEQLDGRYIPADQADTDLAADVFHFVGGQGGGEGVIFDGGDRILILDTMLDQQVGLRFTAKLLERSNASPGHLAGRWIGGDRSSSESLTHRGVRIVVESDEAVYVHNRDDPGALERFQILRGDDDLLTDETAGFEWSGSVSADDDRINGEWVGYDSWYNSMERTRAPDREELTGQWYSIDINWTFSDVETVFGTTTITHEGDTLIAEDIVEGAGTYRLEAEWVGDHFEGSWWDVTSPDVTSPWRGELSADGTYIHGRYSQGEWSFSPAPFIRSDEGIQDANIVFVPDLYSDTMLLARDEESASTLTVYRAQDQVTSFALSMPEGQVDVTVDERFRPTYVEGMGERVEIVWADDSATAAISITRDATGEFAEAVIPIDLSDQALLAMVEETQVSTGRDLDELTEWIEENPGYIMSVARGETRPDLSVTSKGVSRKSAGGTHKSSTQKVAIALNGSAVLATLFGATGIALKSAAATGTIKIFSVAMATALGNGLILAAGIVGAIGLFVAYVVLLVNLMHLLFGDCCEPCGLACFLNCCPPK